MHIMHSLDDEKLTYVIYNSGQNREMWFVRIRNRAKKNILIFSRRDCS